MSDIKELAKELCDKSGCHHKCHDTTDCVVEDEAREYLPFVLTNEGKVSTKDRCIEEMAKVIDYTFVLAEGVGAERPSSRMIAIDLFDANYRKQSDGEWETIPDYSRPLITYRHICSVCKTFYKDIRPHGHKYCHECGSKMKGGK